MRAGGSAGSRPTRGGTEVRESGKVWSKVGEGCGEEDGAAAREGEDLDFELMCFCHVCFETAGFILFYFCHLDCFKILQHF